MRELYVVAQDNVKSGFFASFSCEKYDWWPFAVGRYFVHDAAKTVNGNFTVAR